MRISLLLLLTFSFQFLGGQITGEELLPCDPSWTFIETGQSWGVRGMEKIDLDLDGRPELVTTATGAQQGQYFWQVAQFNSSESAFNYLFRSDLNRPERSVKRLATGQLDNDPQLEIVVIYANNAIIQYDGLSYEVEREVFFPFEEFIYTIVIGDANNDGLAEMVISDEENVYFFNIQDFALLETLNLPLTRSIAIGDPDNDNRQEMVFGKGEVYEYWNGELTLEWTAPHDGTSIASLEEAKLVDIDNDNIPEIIIARRSDVVISDGDTQAEKFRLNINFINKLLIDDVTGDGILDFVVNDTQGEFDVFSTINGFLQDTYSLPFVGSIYGWVADDFDQDGEIELLVGSNEYLQQFSVIDERPEWLSDRFRSTIIETGAIQFDEDENLEVYGLSYAAVLYDTLDNAFVYHPRIYVFDGVTKEIEWRSPAEFFVETTPFNPVFSPEVRNFDCTFGDLNDDGIDDIVFAHHTAFSGSIYLNRYDGATLMVTHSLTLSDNNDFNYELLPIADIDVDGILDILLFDASNGIYKFNPSLTLLSTPEGFGSDYDRFTFHIANIDQDPQLEIMGIAAGRMKVTDGLTYSVWNSPENQFRTIDTYDLTEDGQPEIIGSRGGSSDLNIYDGASFDLLAIQSYDYDYPLFQDLEVVGGNLENIECYSISVDTGDPDGFFVYYLKNNELYRSVVLGRKFNIRFDPLLVTDYDQSGYVSVFSYTAGGIAALDKSCFACVEFAATLEVEQPSCLNGELGTLRLDDSPFFGEMEILWNDSTQADSLTMLPPGAYAVTISNEVGCYAEGEATLSFTPLEVEFNSAPDCNEEQTGQIMSNAEGNLPLEWQWSNGNTTGELTTLPGGWYYVTLTDQASCELQDSIFVSSAILQAELGSSLIDCFGDSNGFVWIDTLISSHLPSWQWSTGAQQIDTISNLSATTYTLQVEDTLGCSLLSSIMLVEPPQISLNLAVIGDDGNTAEFDGSIQLFPTGGTGSYTYDWGDLDTLSYDSFRSDLSFGDYQVDIIDANGCIQSFDITVPLLTKVFPIVEDKTISLFPNPAQVGQTVQLALPSTETIAGTVTVYDNRGRTFLISTIHFSQGKGAFLLQDIPTGLYFVNILVDSQLYSPLKLVIHE